VSENNDSTDRRDPYEPPRIDPLGSFTELTTGTSGAGTDDFGSISANT
jgi:hypothetical protein